MNRAFEDFVGVLESDIRASDPAKWVHPDDREAYVARFKEAVRDKKPFHARFRFRRADGEYRWMKAVGNPRYLSDGRLVGYVGCTFDVTDMKEAESALVELDRGKNEFLAMLAHELRNPLSGVRNASHLLARTNEAAIAAQAREIIERQTVNMVRMVDDLLDISRITHGKIQLRTEPLDLVGAVRAAVEATEAGRQARGQALQLKAPAGALWVRADAMRLDQVVRNLLDNASKFTRQGGHAWVTIERELGSVEGTPVAQAVLRVRDNGVGIDHALLPRVFELFVQSDRHTERTQAGIGLGLALTKRLVDLHGGTIEAFSAGNALGSEFIVRLPLLPEDELPKDAPPARKSKPRPSVDSARRILVVEDNRDSAASLKLLLELDRHVVQTVSEGALVEGAVKEFRPEVVLLDIGLPDLDGHEIARRLRKLPGGESCLIVAVTGYGRAEDRRRSKDSGIDAHLTKPVDPGELAEIIAKGRGRAGSRR